MRTPHPHRKAPSLHLARFRPELLKIIGHYSRDRLGRDIGAGITVGVVALPLAMAFAIASGVNPEAGLFTAVLGGLLVSLLGGSRVQIGGPAGAFIVVVYSIIEQYGLANLLISTILAGILLFLLGLFKLGTLVRFVPLPIVVGFTNGIAVLIGLTQVKDFLGLDIAKVPADFFSQLHAIGTHIQTVSLFSVGLGAACLLLLAIWPRPGNPSRPGRLAQVTRRILPKAFPAQGLHNTLQRIPGTVVVLVLATLATWLFTLPVDTIGNRFGGIPQSLPPFELPEFSWLTVKQLFGPTITIAVLCAIESLLCARVADVMTGDRHDPNQELMAQGVANAVVPFFGGIPVTGTIARTVTNIRAGATSPVAGCVHALTLLVIMLVAAPLAVHVPMAALAAILMMVAWNMGEWRAFASLKRFPLSHRIIMLGTFLLTVVFDLTVAIQVGLGLACVFFIVHMAATTYVRRVALDQEAPDLAEQVHVWALYGTLFFGSTDKIEPLEASTQPPPAITILDLTSLVKLDSSGLDALDHLRQHLQQKGSQLMVCGLAAQPEIEMKRYGFLDKLGASHVAWNLKDALERSRHLLQPAPTA